MDETFDIGSDTRTGVDDSYKLPFQIHWDNRQADLQTRARSQLTAEEKKAATETVAKATD